VAGAAGQKRFNKFIMSMQVIDDDHQYTPQVSMGAVSLQKPTAVSKQGSINPLWFDGVGEWGHFWPVSGRGSPYRSEDVEAVHACKIAINGRAGRADHGIS